MNKPNNKIIDSVSATELLKALSTLQNMNDNHNEMEISFCDQQKIKSQFKHGNSNVIDFDIYMAKKIDNRPPKTPIQTYRKSVSPLKEKTMNDVFKIENLKSRSHSPINKKPEKTDRSINHSIKYTPKARNNKQNKKQDYSKKVEANYRASYQSKKIMDQKQRKGMAYVPIQLRAECLVKQRQVKLAKLQKQQDLNKKIQQKECTFKPNIIKNYKKPKFLASKEDKSKIIYEESLRFEQENEENEFLCTPTQPLQSESTQYLYSQYNKQKTCNQTTINPKKYKNTKFNSLLDLIH